MSKPLKMISAASGVIEPPDLWEKRMPQRFAAACPRVVETPDGLAWCAAGRVVAPIDLGVTHTKAGAAAKLSREELGWLATAEGRLWLQDRDGVAAEVLYSVNPVWNAINASEDEKFIHACYRAYNDWLGEFCADDPARLIGAAKIPTTGVADAIAELSRASDKLKLKGALLDHWPAGKELPPAAGECAEFWQTAASLETPLGLHRPLNGDCEPENEIGGGGAPEFYQDMTTIIYANIPDKNPNIRFVSVSAGAGWAPSNFEALNESYMRTAALRKVNLADPDLLPSDYLRRYFYFVTQEDRTALLNRDYFGDALLMWGSFAFMGAQSEWPNTRQLFERLTAGMPDPARANIASRAVSSLYGLGAAKRFTREEINSYARYGLL